MKEYLKPKIMKLLLIVNIVFLIWHAILLGLFGFKSIWILAGFNVFSLLVYIYTLFALQGGKTHGVVMMMYIELLLHMLISVICMGWDCGFQEYAFGIIPIIMFSDYIEDNRHLRWRSLAMAASVSISYLGLAIWSNTHAPLYTFSTKEGTRLFGIINGSVTVFAVSAYFLMFTRLVLGFERGLMHEASYDSLTGLANRRVLYERFEKLEEDAAFCVFMVDVDNFKKINDTYGHDAGDRVLEAIGNILTENKYQLHDFLPVRWGGEEFVILYNDSNLEREDKLKQMEEIRRRMGSLRIMVGEQALSFTVTIGAADSDEEKTIEGLLALADSRMYYGKTHGKNCLIRLVG